MDRSKSLFGPNWRRPSGNLAILAVLALVLGMAGSCAPADRTASGITIALGQEPSNLDDQIESDMTINYATSYNVSEPLVKMAPDGTLKPFLAESWQAVDQNTTRFNLRQNVKFSDGTPFDAEAAKVSLDRIISPASRVGPARLQAITEVRAPSKYVLELKHKPDVTLLAALAWTGPMYSPKQIRENPDSIKTAPIGTGPYKVVKWEKGVALTLQARDDYWGKDLFGTPRIKDVRVVFRPEAGVRVSLLEAGEADLAPALLPEEGKRLGQSRVVSGEGLEVYTIRFGMKDPLSSDPRIRQAVNLAIDRQKLLELFAGFAKVPAGGQIWPSWVAGWAPRTTGYDLERAKALVREAGAVGKEIEFQVSSGRWLLSAEVGDAVVSMIEQTGLKVKVVRITHQQWLTAIRDLQNPPGMILRSNGHENGDATQNFRGQFMCGGVQGTYCSKEFDAIAEAALNESDRAKRTALVQQATDILVRDLPAIPLVIPDAIYGKNPKLEFTPLPNGLLPVLDMRLGS